jgi:L-ascorbate metabolism protein UlaG (beta-lactamase superfamily)
MKEESMSATIEWLGHDSFRLSDEVTVYIDPWQLSDGAPADLILITHEHFDHCSPEDVQKVLAPNTVILANAASIKLLKENNTQADMREVKAGDKLEVAGVPVEVVPAYNLNKFRSPGEPFHPKQAGHNGYVVTIGGERIYHTGDSDAIPEMKDVACDILLVPVSGTYVMTAEEAVEASRAINPSKLAIPMHYGTIVGNEEDALRFKELWGGEVRILPKSD